MARRKIKAGSVSVTVPIFVQDTSSSTGGGLGSLVYNTSGLDAKYRREGDSSWTTITLATATVGTFTSGGFISDGGPVTGGYEVGIPNAAIAAGAKWAQIVYYGATNMLPVLLEFELDAVDYQDGTAFGLSNLDAAISGLNDLDAADVRSAVGLSSANLDTQIAALPTSSDITDAWQALTFVNGNTYAQGMELIVSAVAGGKTAGLATGSGTLTLKDTGGSTTVATIVYDADHNRTTVTW